MIPATSPTRYFFEEVRRQIESPELAINNLLSLLLQLQSEKLSENEYDELYGFVDEFLPKLFENQKVGQKTGLLEIQLLLDQTSSFHHQQHLLSLKIAHRFVHEIKNYNLPVDGSFRSALHYYSKAIGIDSSNPAPYEEASALFFQVISTIFLNKMDWLKRAYKPDEFAQAIQDIRWLEKFITKQSQLDELCAKLQELINHAGPAFTSNLATLIAIKKTFTPTQIPITKRYAASLKEVRDSISKGIDGFQAWQKFIKDELLADAFLILGPPPCGYDIRAMGSLGKREPCPYSDLEYFILIENDSDRNYFENFARLLDLQVLLLGETAPTETLIFTALGSKNSSGFHIDTGANPAIEPKTHICTPLQMAKMYENISPSVFTNSLEITSLTTSSLATNFPELFNTFLEEAGKRLASGRKVLALGNLQEGLKNFNKQWKRPPPNSDEVQLKEQFTALINYPLTDLALYFNIQYQDRDSLIQELVNLGILTHTSGQILKEITRGIHAIRTRLHLSYGEQCEIAAIPGATSTYLSLTTKEYNCLEKAYFLVLVPLYQCLDELLSNLKTPDDYATVTDIFDVTFHEIDLVERSVQYYLSHKDGLSYAIPCISEALCQTSAPFESHLKYYQNLRSIVTKNDNFRALYLEVLEKHKSPHFTPLSEIPDATGLRQSYLRKQQKLQKNLIAIASSITPQKDRRGISVKVSTSTFKDHYLNPYVIEELISSDGKIKKKHLNSAHNVSELNAPALHFKEEPSQPLMEYAIHSLMYRLFGYLTPTVELARFEVTISGKTITYPVLISETIEGHDLKDPHFSWDKCDQEQWTKMLLATILTRPGDGRPSNYVLDKQNRIYCIDNDISFVEPLTLNLLGMKTIQFYSALFCLFPDAQLKLNTLKEFCRMDSYAILDGWLDELIILEKTWTALFSSQELESLMKPKDSSCRINILLPAGCITQLDIQIATLQTFLRPLISENKSCTPLQLLQQLVSLSLKENFSELSVGKYIAASYEKAMKFAELNKRIASVLPSRDTSKSAKTSYSDTASLGKIPTFKEIQDRALFSPEMAKEELFNSSDPFFKKMGSESLISVRFEPEIDPLRQLWMLHHIIHRFQKEPVKPKSISIRGCSALETETLRALLHENLELLDLYDCPEIQDRDILLIADLCPNLRELYLSGCTHLTSIAIGVFGKLQTPLGGLVKLPLPSVSFGRATNALNTAIEKSPITLVYLNILHVKNCPKLTQILLIAPLLKKCFVEKNPLLEKLDSPAFNLIVHSKDCPTLKNTNTDIKNAVDWLKSVPDNWKSIKEIALAAARQDGLVLKGSIDEKFKKDSDVALLAVTHNGLALSYLHPDLKNNDQIVLAAVQQNPLALQYASNRLKGSTSIVRAAATQNGKALQHAALELQQDADFVLSAIEINSDVFQYATHFNNDHSFGLRAIKRNKKLQNDQLVVLKLVESDGMVLEYASSGLQNNPFVVRAAAKQNIEALRYADPFLKKNEKIMLSILKATCNAKSVFNFSDDDLKINPEFILELVKQDYTVLQLVDGRLKDDKKFMLDVLHTPASSSLYTANLASDRLKRNTDFMNEAVKINGFFLQYGNEDIKKNVTIALEAARQDVEALQFVDESLLGDLQFMLGMLSLKIATYKVVTFAKPNLKDNVEFMTAALQKDGLCLQQASPFLKANFNVALSAMVCNVKALTFVDESLLNNVDFMLSVLSLRIATYEVVTLASANLKNNVEFMTAAVQRDGMCLQQASPSLRDDPIVVLAAVKNNVQALQFAGNSLRNNKPFMLDFLSISNDMLLVVKFAGEQVRNDLEFIIKAAKKEGMVLQFAGTDLKFNHSLFLTAVSQNGLALQYTDIYDNNKQIVLTAVKQNALALQYANGDRRNDENIVLAAVQLNGLALQFASGTLQNDKQIVSAAVEKSGLALKFASGTLQNDKVVVGVAVQKDGLALKFASDKLKGDEATVLKAVRNNLEALDYAEKKTRKKVAIILIEINYCKIEHLPEDLRSDRDVVLAAVRTDGMTLARLKTFQSDEYVVMAAVQRNGLALQFADSMLQDNRSVVQEAVQQNPLALEFASRRLQQDEYIVLEAVRRYGLAIQFADHFLQSNKQIAFAAMQSHPDAKQYVNPVLVEEYERQNNLYSN